MDTKEIKMNYPTELEVMPEAIEVLKGCEKELEAYNDDIMLCGQGFTEGDDCLCPECKQNLKGQITQAKETLKEISRQIEFVGSQLYIMDEEGILDTLYRRAERKLEQLNKRKKQYEVSIKFLEEQVK